MFQLSEQYRKLFRTFHPRHRSRRSVLKHLQLVAFCISNYEDAFRKALGAKRDAEARKELSGKRRTLQKSENRIAELDRLFKRIYEDMVAGRLSEARFQMLSDDYEKEQTELRERSTFA